MGSLDDLKYIHAKDAQDALGIAGTQWEMLTTKYDLPEMDFPIESIVFAGMGGSALWALLSLTWPGYSVPFEIWRRYDAPAYVSDKTLMLISSYSGNTEETISAYEAGKKAGAHIVITASGGRLQEIAEQEGLPFIKLPKSSQPRYAALNGLKSLVTVMEKCGLVTESSAEKTLRHASEFLKEKTSEWAADVPTEKNLAKQLAREVAGTTPVIYAGTLLFPAAYKWKISFNENAKNVAFCNEIPEFSHNEFIGWTSHPVDKPYSVIDLRSSLEHPRIQKRFEVTERLLSGQRPHPIVVDAQGENILEHLLYCVALGDFVSFYTGLLNGLNPTPVDLIEKMKKSLDE